MKRLTVIVLAALLATATESAAAGGPGEATAPPGTRAFGIARLQYRGGGDWYEDRTSLVNLLRGRARAPRHPRGAATARRWSSRARRRSSSTPSCSPAATATSSSPPPRPPTCAATSPPAASCGWTTTSASTRPSAARCSRSSPTRRCVELPFSHPVFHGPYEFPAGLPKIHEHDGGPPRAFGMHPRRAAGRLLLVRRGPRATASRTQRSTATRPRSARPRCAWP